MNVRSRELADDQAPLVDGCPCPACARHARAYLHYLARAEELTAVRLLTLHNLVYLERLVSGAREAIAAGRFAAYRQAGLDGVPPWDA
jgi:queuine tRNA-ribosyltransferase